jgi:hypothetical protein
MLNKGQKVRILKFDTEKNYFNLYQIVEVEKPDKYGAWLVGDDKSGNLESWFYNYNEFELIDSVVESIIEKFRQRSAVGIKKYNTTLDRTDLSEEQWCNHLLEELLDAILYCYRLREQLKYNNK